MLFFMDYIVQKCKHLTFSSLFLIHIKEHLEGNLFILLNHQNYNWLKKRFIELLKNDTRSSKRNLLQTNNPAWVRLNHLLFSFNPTKKITFRYTFNYCLIIRKYYIFVRITDGRCRMSKQSIHKIISLLMVLFNLLC
jgi:hypothetical protein